MKKISLLLSVFAALGFVACSPENAPFEEIRSTPEVIDVVNDFPVPNPQIAMEVFNGSVQASPDGVSVEVTKLTKNKVCFTARPGSSIQSYAINVVPLSLLYNHILEEDGVGASQVFVEDIILKSVFGGAFSGTALNESLLGSEWKNHEFDWVNTEYAQYEILPQTQYVIITVGCYVVIINTICILVKFLAFSGSFIIFCSV